MATSTGARPADGSFERVRSAAARHPHVALVLAVVGTLATDPAVEAGRDASSAVGASSAASILVARAVIAGVCLFVAWEGQRRLRLGPVLACAVLLGLGWSLLHMLSGVEPDKDLQIYATAGSTLLDGTYPSVEYPTGAVSLFALETWVGGESPRAVHAVTMVGFHVVTVAAIWSLRTRWSPWLAAFVAVWPMNAFHWEFRYDLAPTALLIVGLVLALRERWSLAGVALGVGTALKWSPALAFVVLAAWLLARGARRAGAALVTGFVASLAVLTVPFLLWQGEAVLDAYRLQGDRGIMGESVWYLPLAALGLAASPPELLSVDVDVSARFDTAATLAQAALMLALVAFAWRLRDRSRAVALAALTPVAFLLTNRVFSAQFFVLLVAVWAVAAALVVASAREQLAVAVVAAIASSANAAVYPYTVRFAWELASALMFALAIGLTAWLVSRCADTTAASAQPP
jgi:hypothetical protein